MTFGDDFWIKLQRAVVLYAPLVALGQLHPPAYGVVGKVLLPIVIAIGTFAMAIALPVSKSEEKRSKLARFSIVAVPMVLAGLFYPPPGGVLAMAIQCVLVASLALAISFGWLATVGDDRPHSGEN